MNKVSTHIFCKIPEYSEFSSSPLGEGRVGSLEVETNEDEFNQPKESAW
jgi:hypothetical protein